MSGGLYYTPLMPGCLFDAPVHICPACREMTASDSLNVQADGRWACGSCGEAHEQSAGKSREVASEQEAIAALLDGMVSGELH